MISINTNYGGIFAAKASSQSQANVDSAMEKLSSGKRINFAKDDAAGQAIATRLTAEIDGLAMASRNAADAQSMLDTAEGALTETHTILLRMRELAVQSASGTLTDLDRDHTDAEFQELEAEITRISDNTKWAGQGLIDGTAASGISFQIGEGANQTITVSIADMAASAAGLALHDDSLQTASDAQTAIGALDTAIANVSTQRGVLGAASNRLTSTMNNLDQVNVNLTASKGRIEDADFAVETGNLAKNQILQQAATAMVAQANASKSTVMTLLQS
jgi:flagellin